ncbi:MAG: hypothetical protein NTW25_08380 [Candidatus Kapabacteria bacterium]|nr:hypothetical protein [Candidatus Kapabacteria bacterium]
MKKDRILNIFLMLILMSYNSYSLKYKYNKETDLIPFSKGNFWKYVNNRKLNNRVNDTIIKICVKDTILQNTRYWIIEQSNKIEHYRSPFSSDDVFTIIYPDYDEFIDFHFIKENKDGYFDEYESGHSVLYKYPINKSESYQIDNIRYYNNHKRNVDSISNITVKAVCVDTSIVVLNKKYSNVIVYYFSINDGFVFYKDYVSKGIGLIKREIFMRQMGNSKDVKDSRIRLLDNYELYDYKIN